MRDSLAALLWLAPVSRNLPDIAPSIFDRGPAIAIRHVGRGHCQSKCTAPYQRG